MADLQKLFSVTRKTMSSVKTLINRETRDLQKQLIREEKKRNSKKTRGLNGFAKPSKISPELCSFLNVPNGSEMARTEVTSHINKYIKDNSLQNPKNRKAIVPDSNLSSLLAELSAEHQNDGYTYFNLQKYLKHHYLPSNTVSSSSSS